MPTILRIDVDRAYENRILHYARVNQELFPALDSLRYLESCKEVVNDLNERGIKASVFFQPFTVPNKEFAQELMREGTQHRVACGSYEGEGYDNIEGVKTYEVNPKASKLSPLCLKLL